MKYLHQLLKEKYNINSSSIVSMQGGWASKGFKILTQNRNYFLKMYEKNRASTPKLTAQIDQYVPIID